MSRADGVDELLPGTEVVARGLRWEVVSTESLGQETLFRLRGLENAVLGKELDLLFPFEEIEPVRHKLRPGRAAPLINWLVYHQAFLLEQALGPTALLAVQPGRLRIEPYQLVPVLRAIRSSRVRLLLADAVGLGKTVQAGLVITELVARRLAHRVLVVSPAGPLLEQWRLEMAQRFGLRLEVIDRAKLEEIRRSTELGSNPFDFIPLGLVSIDFLKQERILDQLDRASYDIVVVDEAHHCTDTGSIQNTEDSQRRGLAEVLARRCDSLLLLTATPHDGYDRSFASLCELLDPSLVDGRGSLRGERYRNHVIRRLKKHIIDPQTGEQRFKDRIVEPTPVVPDPKKYGKFVELQRNLLDLIAPELRRAFRSKRYADVLAFISLLKRSVSTVAALMSTLQVVAERFQHIISETAEAQESRRQRIKTLRDYQRKLDRFGILSVEEEQERHLLEAEDLAQQLATLQRETRSGSRQLTKVSDIVEQLDEMISLAEACLHKDPKIDRVKDVIAEIRKAEPRANILIYTEYVDSQKALAEALHNFPEIGQVVTMSGLDGEKARASDLLIRGPGGLRGVRVICLQKRGLRDPCLNGLDSVVGNGNDTFRDCRDHLALTRRKIPFPKHYYRSSRMGPPASATLSVSCAKMANGHTSAALSQSFITPRPTATLFGCSLPNGSAGVPAARSISCGPSAFRRTVSFVASTSIAPGA